MIAVVGTRKITGYGMAVTRKITEGLVINNMTIVSGMAYGVDTVAHETAIKNQGKTIAVLGCGVDIIHPVSNTRLYWQIIKENGLVISEFPPGQMATKGLFPARNRIISGLCLGVVITEGTIKSGALITARNAAEQGREVFAVPGPITSDLSDGPTMLLKHGAKLVTQVQDVLEELKINSKSEYRNPKKIPNSNYQSLSKEEKIIIELLTRESLHFDDLVRESGLLSSTVGSLLTELEMKNIINKHNDGKYYRVN
jgi:DNA processing protein